MCGIFCIFQNTVLKTDTFNLIDIAEQFKPSLQKRGPDSFHTQSCHHENYNFLFAASVLWLQGEEITEQPLDNNYSTFVYNGDIFDGLNTCKDQGDTSTLLQVLEESDDVSLTLSNIQGPYAFIYLDKISLRLYFGRDIYGRRSLLISKQADIILITSVAKRNTGFDFIELPAIGIFYLDLKTNDIVLTPWKFKNKNFSLKLNELKEFLQIEIYTNEKLSIESSEFVEINEGNIFTSIRGLKFSEIQQRLLNDSLWLRNVQTLKQKLEKAIDTRISTQPKFCYNCLQERNPCNHALTGVLFSGGLDCAILTLLADKFVDKNRPIDLFNVSFKDDNVPDRISGLKTLDELKKLCPHRKWNFLEINVTPEELNFERDRQIADLIYPLQSILDESLGCALWFGSRGETVSYKSPCRTVLVGMGADELFGGYTRHRAAFKKNGWFGLQQVLEEDWQNLSFRNLARDDRVVSDHGRQLRTPYLDENVVEFVRNLKIWQRTFPPEELGDKILLRNLAFSLGLIGAAGFKKRALQFGSRIANKKENGNAISPRL